MRTCSRDGGMGRGMVCGDMSWYVMGSWGMDGVIQLGGRAVEGGDGIQASVFRSCEIRKLEAPGSVSCGPLLDREIEVRSFCAGMKLHGDSRG